MKITWLFNGLTDLAPVSERGWGWYEGSHKSWQTWFSTCPDGLRAGLEPRQNLTRLILLSIHSPEAPADQGQHEEHKHNQDQGIDKYITEQEYFR